MMDRSLKGAIERKDLSAFEACLDQVKKAEVLIAVAESNFIPALELLRERKILKDYIGIAVMQCAEKGRKNALRILLPYLEDGFFDAVLKAALQIARVNDQGTREILVDESARRQRNAQSVTATTAVPAQGM